MNSPGTATWAVACHSANATRWIGALLIAGSTFGYGQDDKGVPLTLEDAIRDRNAPALESLIDAGAVVNDPELLSFAVVRGGVEIVKLLVDAGANPNTAMPIPRDQEEGFRNLFGPSAEVVSHTPLSVAALMGRFETAEFLLKEGADPNVVTSIGTPIGLAATRGHADVVRLLIESGGDASGRSLSGTAAVMFSPLLGATKAGNFDVVEVLVRSGGYRCPGSSSFTMGDIAFRAALDQLLEKAGSELRALMDRAQEACGAP